MRAWVTVSATVAPIALIGGWTWAAARQPHGYDPLRDTISALAARDAPHAWVMTTGLAVLGLCHLATAAGLTEAAVPGRVILGAGGLSTVLVAASPQPATLHVPAATLGFVCLAFWPAFSAVPGRRAALVAAAVLAGLVGWLMAELQGGGLVGLSERAAAGSQALWPLAAVLTLRRRRG